MNNLPELTGSEKQISWAEKLRPAMIEFIDRQIAMLPTWGEANGMAAELGVSRDDVIEKVRARLEKWRNDDRASFWIDRRSDYKIFLSAFEAGLKLF